MRHRSIFPVVALGAAVALSGCGRDDQAGYDTVPPAQETTPPGAVGGTGTTTDPTLTPGMTTDTAVWGDTAGLGTGMDTMPRTGNPPR